ncbi:MAG: glycosyltransferase family 39 protein [Candidatus Pacebacteria bacterium]|nr:glycosyltransferase family 39 protein [Candidatus Paceibacterota bacterium]
MTRSESRQDKITKLFLVFLLLIGFFYRFYGLGTNYSFWIDEFSTGQAASAILKTGHPRTIGGFFESRNLLNHYLTALSLKIFGVSEFAARFPSVIWGTLMISVSFWAFKKFFNGRIGLAVAILITFSMIEITWSRQARSYALFQLLFLMSACLFYLLFGRIETGKVKLKEVLWLIFFLMISFLAHPLTFVLLPAALVYGGFFCRRPLLSILKKTNKKQRLFGYSVVFGLGFFAWQFAFGDFLRRVFITRRISLGIFNHFSFYHAFFWREYGLISFLALLGLIRGFLTKEKKHFFLATVLGVYLGIVFFFLPWLDIKYLLGVFPVFFFAYLAYFLDDLAEGWFGKKGLIKAVFLFLSIVFIIFNGHKFTFRPRVYYSPNADMRRIPLVDYNLVYAKIRSQVGKGDQTVAVVDTWGDRIAWYLGRDYPAAFWLRKQKNYQLKGGKKIDTIYHYGVILNEADLKSVIQDYPQGFIFIDGHELPFLPIDALDYLRDNLKPELEFTRFSLDPDPYDTWPAWLYSWGVKG